MKRTKGKVMGCWAVSGNYDKKYIKFVCIGVDEDIKDIFNIVMSTYIPENLNKKTSEDDLISISIKDKKKYDKVTTYDYKTSIDKKLKKVGKNILKKFNFIIIRNVV